jgi:TonB family protein
MNAMLLWMLLTSSLGLVMVLLMRKPMRRIFGAGPAFTLWCLPPLLAVAPLMPLPATTRPLQPLLATLPVQAWVTADSAPNHAYTWLIALWLLGMAYGVVNLSMRYARLARGCQPMPDVIRRRLLAEHPGLAKRELRLHTHGPAVMWAPRPRLLLPADFLQRYDADARDMVLRHELTHLRRGDAWWSLLSECALVLLWFHPLAWLALPRFHLDQELACDERVLRTSPERELQYAQTLMHSVGIDAHPAMIPWLTEPQLKERLTMISRPPCSTWRRRLGYVALVALLASSAVVAQTGSPASGGSSAGPTQDVSFNASIPPPYPQDALRNREQGLVILKVLVGTDGTAHRIDIDADATKAPPELAKVASDTAMKWHFNPKLENGKAIEAWIKVPVLFSLTPLPPHPHGPPPPPGAMPPPPPGMGPPPPPPPPGGGPGQPTSSNS